MLEVYPHFAGRICRRCVPVAFTLLAWLWLIELSRAVEPQAKTRPNILLLLADNWGWPHAGAYGDRVIKTPAFDAIAREGVLFSHAFCVNPSCTPSRAALLTGQVTHRLEDSGNLWSTLSQEYEVYPELLRRAGYFVGLTGKGWGPGNWAASGWKHNPAGPEFASFAAFLQQLPDDRPFCFWYGPRPPHRSYVKGSGVQAGLNPDDVVVPGYLPDTPEVRSDILDYSLAVQQFDAGAGEVLKLLAESGRADNTLVMIAGDNGWQFPRGLANVYDSGTRVPLAIRWPARVKGGRQSAGFVDFTDLAPTFLSAAGLPVPARMTGKSLLPLLDGKEAGRDHVFLERERHANVRRGDRSYPCRALRTKDYLYVRNLQPELWPAGDPETHFAVGPFGDVDPSPTKEQILARRHEPGFARFYHLAFARRPAEELYVLAQDPWQIANVVDDARYAAVRKELRARLERWMAETGDPRVVRPNDERWDRFPYHGKARKADAK